MAMYYTIASRGTAGTEPLQVRRGRKLKERRPIARSARGAAGWRARLPPPRNPNACLRTASNNSTQYRNVNYRLTLTQHTGRRAPVRVRPTRSSAVTTRRHATAISRTVYRTQQISIPSSRSCHLGPTGRDRKSGRLSSCHFAFSARRLPLDEGALLWAGYTSLLSRQLRHGLRMVSQMIASPHGHSRHVSPRRARGRLQAPISFWSPRRLHPPSFPLIVAEASRQRSRSVLPLRGAWYNAHRGLGRLASVFPG